MQKEKQPHWNEMDRVFPCGIVEPTTQAEARQYAIDWQNWFSNNQHLSYAELANWHAIFTILAEKFDLVEEFKENGII